MVEYLMNTMLEKLVQRLHGSDQYEILYKNDSELALIRLKDQLMLVGSEEGLKTGISNFLNSELLDNFRMVRSLYHHQAVKDMVLDALCSKRDKIADVLKEHYGPFTYSPHESAFDEYLISMREVYGMTFSDQQILDHAGVSSMKEIIGLGYNGRNQYVIDRIIPQDREKLLVENGGLSYQEWIEKEIDRFWKKPSLLFRQYSCVFENLFPEVITLDKAIFIDAFQTLDLSLMVELVFGKDAKCRFFTEDESQITYIQDISLKLEQYWCSS